jgi:hypothetical protein
VDKDYTARDYMARRLEQRLGEDERTAELGIRIQLRGDRLFAEGQVMSEERRQAVIALIHEFEPEAEVVDQLTVTADRLESPGTTETIDARTGQTAASDEATS